MSSLPSDLFFRSFLTKILYFSFIPLNIICSVFLNIIRNLADVVKKGLLGDGFCNGRSKERVFKLRVMVIQALSLRLLFYPSNGRQVTLTTMHCSKCNTEIFP